MARTLRKKRPAVEKTPPDAEHAKLTKRVKSKGSDFGDDKKETPPDVKHDEHDEHEKQAKHTTHIKLEGPDLDDVKGDLEPSHDAAPISSSSNQTSANPQSKLSSAYDADPEQHCSDLSAEPDNYKDLCDCLISSEDSRITRSNHKDFISAIETSNTTKIEFRYNIFPLMNEHTYQSEHSSDRWLTTSTPIGVKRRLVDLYDGARYSAMDDVEVREKLYHILRPFPFGSPIAPNLFFVFSCGSVEKAEERANPLGELGANIMHALQCYPSDEIPKYDNNAYAFTVILDGKRKELRLYAHHLATPTESGGRLDCHKTLLGHYNLTNEDQYVKGKSALGNLRRRAKEYRDHFIQDAKASHRSVIKKEQQDEGSIPVKFYDAVS